MQEFVYGPVWTLLLMTFFYKVTIVSYLSIFLYLYKTLNFFTGRTRCKSFKWYSYSLRYYRCIVTEIRYLFLYTMWTKICKALNIIANICFASSVSSKTMNEYTHVILDEVHERGQEMDFLLLVVKKLLYTVSPTVKVILMSATFNIKAFADYFMIPTPRGLQMSSCVKVEKKGAMFTVKTFYLNHLNKFGSVSVFLFILNLINCMSYYQNLFLELKILLNHAVFWTLYFTLIFSNFNLIAT